MKFCVYWKGKGVKHLANLERMFSNEGIKDDERKEQGH